MSHDATPGEGQPPSSPADGAAPGAPADPSPGAGDDRAGRDPDVDPDLSSAARALAAFVASERKILGELAAHADGPPYSGQSSRGQDLPDQDFSEQDSPEQDFSGQDSPDQDSPDQDFSGEEEPYPGQHTAYDEQPEYSDPYSLEFGQDPEYGSEPSRGRAPRAVPPRGISGPFFGRGADQGEERHEAPPPPPAEFFTPTPVPPPGSGQAIFGRVHEPLGSPQATFGGTQAARVALVTGAGRGIGRAIALGLGRAGVSVALLGRSPDALEQVAAEIASYGVAASWAGADVRDYIQIGNAVERLESAIGEIDLLVNNAGVIEPVEVPVWEAGPETWWHVVETDLRGPFHCVRAVVPGMIERGGGRVVNLSSGVGAGDKDVYSAYAAAKAGLFRITGSLHLAGYRHGLRAFELSPGTVRTDMTSTMAVHSGRQEWTPVEAVVDLVVAVAAGRLDAWSGGFLRAGVDTPESLDSAELAAGEDGLPPTARRLGVLPYGGDDPLMTYFARTVRQLPR